jgi:hypothetical protein
MDVHNPQPILLIVEAVWVACWSLRNVQVLIPNPKIMVVMVVMVVKNQITCLSRAQALGESSDFTCIVGRAFPTNSATPSRHQLCRPPLSPVHIAVFSCDRTCLSLLAPLPTTQTQLLPG